MADGGLNSQGQRPNHSRRSGLGNGIGEFRQRHMSIAVQHVIGTKRNDMPAWQHMVRAALHQPADVEVVGVQEAGDCDTKVSFGDELLGEDVGDELVVWRRLGKLRG